MSIILDKVLIEVIKAKERLYTFNSHKELLINKYTDLFQVNLNTIYTNNKA